MLQREPVILVIDRATERVMTRCVGPDPDGSCPHVAPGELVPCAGHKLLILEGEGIDGLELAVSPGEVSCPVAADSTA
jgi:hypothetical protein